MAEKFILKKTTFLLNHITELLEIVLIKRPVDFHIRAYFRKNKYLGSKDRFIIKEVIYFILRTYPLISKYDNISSHAFYLCYRESIEFRNQLNRLVRGFDPDNVLSIDADIFNAYKNCNAEDFFPRSFLEIQIGINSNLLISLNQPATTDIRIISHKDEVISELKDNNIDYSFNLLENCVKISSRFTLNNLKTYKKGFFEIQDEGSQLISHFLPLKDSESILDACAGGGGKSIHMAELTNSKKRIVSTDIKHSRLSELKRRAERLKLRSIEVYKFEEVKQKNTFFDLVLIDAPCSGSGTLRRSPELRYDLSTEKIKKYTEIQYNLLRDFSGKVTLGGTLAYVTCSIFEAENENVVEKFLNSHPGFELIMPTAPDFLPGTTDLIRSDKYIKLNPLENKTDGFFMALLKKVK